MSDGENSGLPQLAATARLFGRLFVRELDRQTLAEMQQPELRMALAELGLEVPSDDALDELARAWLDCFLMPANGRPPVQSLYEEDAYDGGAALAVKEIARRAGRELAPAARNAPPDHVGCILLLWAEVAEDHPDLARSLVVRHLDWVDAALRPIAAQQESAFYAAVARSGLEFLSVLQRVSSGDSAMD